MARRTYTGNAINVSFDAARCIHSARCLRGLPQVFDLDAKPWIAPDAAPAADIAALIEQCPSGALRYERLDGGPPEAPDAKVTVQPLPNGPLAIRGDITLLGSDGEPLDAGYRAALCRCGGSANKPFCDNTHRTNGFTAP